MTFRIFCRTGWDLLILQIHLSELNDPENLTLGFGHMLLRGEDLKAPMIIQIIKFVFCFAPWFIIKPQSVIDLQHVYIISFAYINDFKIMEKMINPKLSLLFKKIITSFPLIYQSGCWLKKSTLNNILHFEKEVTKSFPLRILFTLAIILDIKSAYNDSTEFHNNLQIGILVVICY